jgi:DNA polymerase-3 subunit alpha
MRRALMDMRPDRFEDIIALVALYRPGPDGEHPDLIARASTAGAAEYIHPKLEPVLRETFGVIVYQEQVMEAARRLSGYSLGEPTCCAARWARRSAAKWRRSASASSKAQ